MAEEFPTWKKAAIEAMRVFVGVFVSQIVILVSVPQVKYTLLTCANSVAGCLIPFDQQCFFGATIWSDTWVLLILPSVMAAIQGLMKWLREEYAKYKNGVRDYGHVLYKLPF